mmetsp:Transcript_61536/g.169094  ORF Transcript_61536/g.169094 Transcript_61536/m.169094 type:complete len:205 (+) Transcript_61536:773-1387(+)
MVDHIIHGHTLALELTKHNVRRLDDVNVYRMAQLVDPRYKVLVALFDHVEMRLRPRKDRLDVRRRPPLHGLGPPLLGQRDISVVHIEPPLRHTGEHVADLLPVLRRAINRCQKRAIAELAAVLPVPIHQLDVEDAQRPRRLAFSCSHRGPRFCARARPRARALRGSARGRERAREEPELLQQLDDHRGEGTQPAIEPVRGPHID